jgi:hypothetical protein
VTELIMPACCVCEDGQLVSGGMIVVITTAGSKRGLTDAGCVSVYGGKFKATQQKAHGAVVRQQLLLHTFALA